ncbi:EscU/YscU/HrcU family type III secretion system export apparatus switch protein [Sporosarcina sp. GW1-11]|uniref:EscU/YscU/HrcU family type III secretion system export apparatus switch protein n=1 Tax=Sporosarcina sp. GW1-11 TaxID=2899126 RepID=UPI00294F2377|nr:EscU/YscU/HrcU family type III secretion system export apparatus switch protein [Sporosarcina sp. GW1-11]MDV6376732.1 EscU/YscU/HrcU family type III secretion system export apparatus switch protein [Sporosarcina sp. GW1-11]
MSEERYKRKEAVALSYEPEVSDAPKVIAKGKGKIAENILERAKQHNVPIQEDPSLLELLGQLNVNETIPEELYQAVSEVFAYIYRLDKEKGSGSS